MSPALAIAAKDLRLLVRDRSSCFFTFIFPILLAIFFGAVFGGKGGGGAMEIALAIEDTGPAAEAFGADIGADKSLKVHRVASREDGERLVRHGDVSALVVIPSGFQEAADGIFAGRSMGVEAVVDPRRRTEAGLLTGKLNELAFRQMSRMFQDPERMQKQLVSAKAIVALAPGLTADQRRVFTEFADKLGELRSSGVGDRDPDDGAGGGGWRPVNVDVREMEVTSKGPSSAYEVSYAQGVVWGLMGCVTAFGVSLAEERARGTLVRLSSAPIGRPTILAGKAVACFVACMLVQATLMLVMGVGFGVRVSSWPLMILAAALSSVGFVGVMMLLAGASRTEGGASGMGRAVVLVMAMIGGGTIPVFFMPPLMQTASGISPFKWATLAVEGALWRQFTPADMVLPGAVLLGFGVIGFVLGASLFRWGDAS